MFKKGRTFLAVVVLMLGATKASAVELGSVRKAIFKVRVISQEPDYKQPWNHQPVKSSSGTGFYIGSAGILTNAHVVANGKFISVLKDGDDEPVSARVKFMAHDCDLALLEVLDPAYFQGVAPIAFGDIPEVRETVNTVGYPSGGEQLSITQGVVSRVSYRRYVHSAADSHLLVQVDSAINPGNSGGPVLQGKVAVGVAFQAFTGAENTGYIIPTPVIKRFLSDIADGRYDGHPVQGFSVQDGALENVATRRYHGLKAGEGGVKVSEVASYSPLAGSVASGDIVLSIDGKPVGIDGKISYLGERLSFRVLYDLKQRGDALKLEILRGGQRRKVDVVLKAKQPFYDGAHIYLNQPRYLNFAGLVFSSLSRDYLETWGRSWAVDAPLHLRYIHNHFSQIPDLQGARDVVVLTERLPHAVNTFAGPFLDAVVIRVNGKKILSLDDLARVLDEADGPHLVFEFWQEEVPLILPLAASRGADKDITARYKIPLTRWLGPDEDGATADWGADK
ncbi:MAG TPA: trypsin-like peptidase domain-containing protein [Oligoflexus sp.]|uniref:S1C family serine protease n=1 Tax=Oligoflexus sp. TaxID=1971216 RepID=UPI002D36F9C2|nr:trypsin-like peptidase domain-containing protein [Oligoflexus sp.]HYX35975.1 trypsin-like peptidase domain-containing protein [Oligoflexus sp.]